MNFAEKAKEVQNWFAEHGHQAFPSSLNDQYVGLSEEEKDKLKLEHKYNHDAIREHWNVIEKCDVVLVLNYDKNGIAGYVGGNSFLEIGFAHIQKKPIYLLNPVPAISFYDTEIIAMAPQILNNDLSRLFS